MSPSDVACCPMAEPTSWALNHAAECRSSAEGRAAIAGALDSHRPLMHRQSACSPALGGSFTMVVCDTVIFCANTFVYSRRFHFRCTDREDTEAYVRGPGLQRWFGRLIASRRSCRGLRDCRSTAADWSAG
jgi:hypothetical protein